MNDKQKAWLEAYIDSGDARKATKLVYTDVQGKSIATKTSFLKQTLADEIDNHARAQYKKEAPLMLSIIKDLALNAKQDAVRLKSADTWLSRAGHDAAQVLEVKETATHEELLNRLKIISQGLPQDILDNVLGTQLTQQLKGDDDETITDTKH